MKEIITTKQFRKDFKLIEKRSLNMQKLFNIIEVLRNDEILHKKHKQHKLTGIYKNFSECHITPDWLLIYKIEKNLLTLYRTGSHSDLF